ncbi:hypothetical protein CBL_01705 [Carabus blaptoides fortunei]
MAFLIKTRIHPAHFNHKARLAGSMATAFLCLDAHTTTNVWPELDKQWIPLDSLAERVNNHLSPVYKKRFGRGFMGLTINRTAHLEHEAQPERSMDLRGSVRVYRFGRDAHPL